MPSSRTYPKRPEEPEDKYVDYEEEMDLWGIFGLESGHCYQLFCSEDIAKKALERSYQQDSNQGNA